MKKTFGTKGKAAKRAIVRAAVLALALFLLLPSLCGCAQDRVALSFGGAKITSGMYAYWFSCYKNYYLYVFGGEDSADYFNTAMQGGTDGETIGSYFETQINDVIKSNAASLYLFDSYGLSLNDAQKADVEQILSSKIEEAGGRAALNEKLGKMGINIDTFKQVLTAEAKVTALYTYLFGDSAQSIAGVEAISDAERETFYAENYVCVKQILIRTEVKNKVGEDGYAVTDDNGAIITEPLTEAEKAEKQKTVETVEKALQGGGSFEELMEQYNEDTSEKTYTSGYLVSAFAGFEKTFADAAMNLEMGQWVRIDTDAGVQFLKRYALVETPWSDAVYTKMLNGFQNYLESNHFSVMTREIVSQIRRNESVIGPLEDVVTADISFWS